MIRRAILTDAPAIAAIWNAVIDLPHITFAARHRTDEEVARLIVDRARQFWVLAKGETVTGFATYGSFRTGSGYHHTAEHTIHITPAAQGAGQGRALMETLEDAARTNRIRTLVAAISGANPDAVAFHDHLGFDHSGRIVEAGRKDGRWYDLILMHKSLRNPDSAANSG